MPYEVNGDLILQKASTPRTVYMILKPVKQPLSAVELFLRLKCKYPLTPQA